MTNIPVSDLVAVYPQVVGIGGSALDFCALAITKSTDVPINQPLRFTSAATVGQFFGVSSDEYLFAQTYFKGYVGSTRQPAFLLFGSYAASARQSWIRGVSRNFLLSDLQALTGTLSVTINGSKETSGQVTLAAATSLSNVAEIIQAAMPTQNITVSYNGTLQAFSVTANGAGSANQITACSDNLADALGLSSPSAIISSGLDAEDASSAIDRAANYTRDFVTIVPVFAMSDAEIVSANAWNTGQNSRFIFIAWGAPVDALTSNDKTSFAYQIISSGSDGVVPFWTSDVNKPAFLAGYIASVAYGEDDSRTIAAWRRGDGLSADVTQQKVSNALLANSYNFYGSYAEANNQFSIFYPGLITGKFKWIDSYCSQVWLNITLQSAMTSLLLNTNRVPVNIDGYSLVETALMPVLTQAISSQVITKGITPTQDEIAQIQKITGSDVSSAIYSNGYFLYVEPMSAEQRAARGRLPAYLFYADGEAIQTIDLTSSLVE